MKKCSKDGCNKNTPQPLQNFYKNARNKDGLQKHCKKCMADFCKKSNAKYREEYNQKRKEYWMRNIGRFKKVARDRWLFRTYGITIEEYNEMLMQQGNSCKICGINQNKLKTKMHVDHDHETGKVRAILCKNCNHLIGNCFEKKEILSQSIAYLTYHGK